MNQNIDHGRLTKLRTQRTFTGGSTRHSAGACMLCPHSQAIAKRYISFRSPGLILGKMICMMPEMHILTEKFSNCLTHAEGKSSLLSEDVNALWYTWMTQDLLPHSCHIPATYPIAKL